MTTAPRTGVTRELIRAVWKIIPSAHIHRWRKPHTSLGRFLARRMGVWTRSARGSTTGILSRETWDAQYAAGHWSFLRGPGEVPHNSVIVGLLRQLRPNAAVLDVGCGEGVLFSAIRPYGYERFLGIDISAIAIAAIAGAADGRTTFIATDAETYEPSESYDAIIFNESLYYFRDPLATLRRYARHLAPGGIVIVSIYHESRRMRKLVRDAQREMLVVADVTVSTRGAVWSVLALAPCRT